MTRSLRLVSALALGLFLPSSALTFEPLTALLTIQQLRHGVGQLRGHVDRLKKRLRREPRAKPPEVGPLLERMRSPFGEDRLAAAKEMQALAEDHAEDPEVIPELVRIEVLLGQLLRDENFRTRYTAYRTLVTLGMMEPVEDRDERRALLYPRRLPERRGVVAPAGAVGPTDIDLVYEFLRALRTRKPAVRTELAAVLRGLDAKLGAPPPAGPMVDVPAEASPEAGPPLPVPGLSLPAGLPRGLF